MEAATTLLRTSDFLEADDCLEADVAASDAGDAVAAPMEAFLVIASACCIAFPMFLFSFQPDITLAHQHYTAQLAQTIAALCISESWANLD